MPTIGETPSTSSILGGGSGGYASALRAAQLGPVRRADREGQARRHLPAPRLHPDQGAAARGEVADQTREAEQFGIKAELVGIDMAGVNAYKDGVVGRLYKGLQGLVKAAKVDYVEGEGRLVGAAPSWSATGSATGRNIVLATGSYSRSPARPRDRRAGHRPASTRWRSDRCPTRAIVLGGGVIGVEFASAWKSFGAEVTIVEALPRLVAGRGRGRAPSSWSARSASAASSFKVGKPFEKRRADRRGVKVHHRRRRDARGRAAAGRRRPRPGHRRTAATRSRASRWTAASSSPTSGCAPTCPTSTPSATSCPACSSRTAASRRASSSPRRSPG